MKPLLLRGAAEREKAARTASKLTVTRTWSGKTSTPAAAGKRPSTTATVAVAASSALRDILS
jgi:hypothetical protein